jgi:hypothetical protein
LKGGHSRRLSRCGNLGDSCRSACQMLRLVSECILRQPDLSGASSITRGSTQGFLIQFVLRHGDFFV